MSTVYNLGEGDADEKTAALQKILPEQKHPNSTPGLYSPCGGDADGLLRFCASMREHGGGGAPRDERLEMAALPMVLHGAAGVGAGVCDLSRREIVGVEIKSSAWASVRCSRFLPLLRRRSGRGRGRNIYRLKPEDRLRLQTDTLLRRSMAATAAWPQLPP